MKKHNRIKLRTFHRLFATIVGIQLTFWVVSGIYFAVLPSSTLRNDDVSAAPPAAAPLNPAALVAPQNLALPTAGIRELRLVNLPSIGPSYLVTTDSDQQLTFDANTGALRPVLSSDAAKAIARNHFADPKPAIAAVTLLTAASGPQPDEYRGNLPVYQIAFADSRSTNLYLDPVTGTVRAQRNQYWRLYDFLWRLHILDFDTGEDHNNNLLRVLAISAVLVMISGYALFFLSPTFHRWQRRLPWGNRHQP